MKIVHIDTYRGGLLLHREQNFIGGLYLKKRHLLYTEKDFFYIQGLFTAFTYREGLHLCTVEGVRLVLATRHLPIIKKMIQI